jgi:hypothetical protein
MLCNFQKKFINNEENNKIFEEKCETPLGYLNLTHIFEKNVKNSTYVKQGVSVAVKDPHLDHHHHPTHFLLLLY